MLGGVHRQLMHRQREGQGVTRIEQDIEIAEGRRALVRQVGLHLAAHDGVRRHVGPFGPREKVVGARDGQQPVGQGPLHGVHARGGGGPEAHDRQDGGERVLDPVLELAQQKGAPVLGTAALGHVEPQEEHGRLAVAAAVAEQGFERHVVGTVVGQAHVEPPRLAALDRPRDGLAKLGGDIAGQGVEHRPAPVIGAGELVQHADRPDEAAPRVDLDHEDRVLRDGQLQAVERALELAFEVLLLGHLPHAAADREHLVARPHGVVVHDPVAHPVGLGGRGAAHRDAHHRLARLEHVPLPLGHALVDVGDQLVLPLADMRRDGKAVHRRELLVDANPPQLAIHQRQPDGGRVVERFELAVLLRQIALLALQQLLGALALGDVEEGQDEAVQAVVDRAVGLDAHDERLVGRRDGHLALDRPQRPAHLVRVLGERVVAEALRDLGDGPPLVALAHAEQVRDLGREAAHAKLRVEEQRRDLRRFQQVLEVGVRALELAVVLAQLRVHRFEFLVDALQLLAGGFELLVGGLHLLVHGEQFFVGVAQLLGRDLVLGQGDVELLAGGGELALQAQALGRVLALGLALQHGGLRLGEIAQDDHEPALRHGSDLDADQPSRVALADQHGAPFGVAPAAQLREGRAHGQAQGRQQEVVQPGGYLAAVGTHEARHALGQEHHVPLGVDHGVGRGEALEEELLGLASQRAVGGRGVPLWRHVPRAVARARRRVRHGRVGALHRGVAAEHAVGLVDRLEEVLVRP